MATKKALSPDVKYVRVRHENGWENNMREDVAKKLERKENESAIKILGPASGPARVDDVPGVKRTMIRSGDPDIQMSESQESVGVSR